LPWRYGSWYTTAMFISVCSHMHMKDLLHNVEIHLSASLLITSKPCAECKAATACFMPRGNKSPDHAVLGDQPWQKTSVWRHRGDPRELQRSPRWGSVILLVIYTTSAPQPPSPPSSEPSPVLPSLHAKVCITKSMRLGYLPYRCRVQYAPTFDFLCFLYALAGPLLCGISMLWLVSALFFSLLVAMS
jgi:hypothetical protein